MFPTVALVLFGIAVVVAAGVPVATAPVPKHLMKEAEGDKDKFQGKWRVESLKIGDGGILALFGQQGFEMVVEFRGDQFVAAVNIQGQAQNSTATLKYDAAKRQLGMTNRWLSLTNQRAGPNEAAMNNPQEDLTMGSAFDGDNLLLASRPRDDRGKAADPLKPGKNDIVMVLVRVKP